MTSLVAAIGAVVISGAMLGFNVGLGAVDRGSWLTGNRKAYAVAASASIFVFSVGFAAALVWLEVAQW